MFAYMHLRQILYWAWRFLFLFIVGGQVLGEPSAYGAADRSDDGRVGYVRGCCHFLPAGDRPPGKALQSGESPPRLSESFFVAYFRVLPHIDLMKIAPTFLGKNYLELMLDDICLFCLVVVCSPLTLAPHPCIAEKKKMVEILII